MPSALFDTGGAPGTLVRMAGDEIPVFLDVSKVSPHQEGLQDLLAVATLKGYLPDEVVFWGAQIEALGLGLELSSAVAAQVDALIEKVLAELARWGVNAQRKTGKPPIQDALLAGCPRQAHR